MEQNTLSEVETVPRNSEYRSVPPENKTTILAGLKEFFMKKGNTFPNYEMADCIVHDVHRVQTYGLHLKSGFLSLGI